MKQKTQLKNQPVLKGYLYPFEESKKARDEGRFLPLRIETSLACNLACEYCYRDSGKKGKDEMTFTELTDIVNQAHDLGAQSVVIIGGGEPTVYKQFRELVSYIDDLGMVPVVITNGQTMTSDLAKFLHERNASVMIKLDSLKEDVQDKLAGREGAYKRIQEGLQNLLGAGFGNGDNRLGASFVTNKLNLDEVETIWRFCRENSIFPNMEVMTPNGRAKSHPDWIPTAKEVEEAKERLLKIDEADYGYTWNPNTPIVGAGCRQHEYSLYITVEGYARPCAAVHVNHVNVRRKNSDSDKPLADALKDPFIDRARHAEQYLTGKCGQCKYKANECIGCRGTAYVYGINSGLDPFNAIVSEDPLCPKRVKIDEKILEMPLKQYFEKMR